MVEQHPSNTTLTMEIAGTPHALVDQERLSILAEALGEQKLTELLAEALRSAAESARDLRRHWGVGDSFQAGRAAHRLTGVAANFGFTALAALAGAIERDCLSGGDGRTHSPLLDRVEAATADACGNIHRN
ncbi:MAG: Hpt domain-containing protein [Telmatospirillum sp.]|nr:Hpt domain-containing protein [Telmatospirillum sp.]